MVYLKNADATKLATTLRAAIAGESRSGAVTTPATPATSGTPAAAGAGASTANLSASAQPSTGGQIQADPATNALIITAPEPQYRQLRSVIDMLDQRRAQVFVESLIAEVNADKAAAFLNRLIDSNPARRAFFEPFGTIKSHDLTDGLRLDFESGDVIHLRPSGNAPEFRIYAQSGTQESARVLVAAAMKAVSAEVL